MAHRKALRDYYLVLGLQPGASLGEVKKAYRAEVKRWHPDRFNCDPRLGQGAEEKLKEINEAYSALCGRGWGPLRYGRPNAGQSVRTNGGTAAGAASGWQSDAWHGAAARASFKFQSAYYRGRQARARASTTGDRDPYSAAFAGYAAGPRLTKATIRRWIIIVFVFCVLSYINPFAVFRSVAARRAAGASNATRTARPVTPPPAFDVHAAGNGSVPMVTIVERPAGKYEFPAAIGKKKPTPDSPRPERDHGATPARGRKADRIRSFVSGSRPNRLIKTAGFRP